MKIKNIVSFGCSWPHGTELIDPDLTSADEQLNEPYRLAHSYPGLIAAHYGWTLDDHTEVNKTLPSMLEDFTEWLLDASVGDQLQSLVLINLTRESVTGAVDRCPAELTYKVITDKNCDIDHQVFEWIVAKFDELAAQHRVPMLQFNVLARQHKLKYPTLIESSSALEMLVIRDKPRKAPLFAEYKHPNEKGHLILSEFLIDKIDSVILNEC